jgi:hypothetical protein
VSDFVVVSCDNAGRKKGKKIKKAIFFSWQISGVSIIQNA